MSLQRVDRIEQRRFVGRELLLWLWMESELFESTLATEEHGSFGFWLENKLVLSAETESTRIRAAMPGAGREAKEALLRGQLPESMGIRISHEGEETSLALGADKLGVTGLKLAALKEEHDGHVPGDLVDELSGKNQRRKKKKQVEEIDDSPFYDRMEKTAAVEALLTALYRDFLALRLSPRWNALIAPTMRRWAMGEPIDADAYRAAKRGKRPRKR
jgi:hypothetical protein